MKQMILEACSRSWRTVLLSILTAVTAACGPGGAFPGGPGSEDEANVETDVAGDAEAGAGGDGELATETQGLHATYVQLRSFWNPAHGDNALTSNPYFSHAGYGAFRVEGHIFNPANPQPRGTRPLYTWYSPSRGDYFTTSNPAWAGTSGAHRSGYNFVRMEGYVYESSVAGTLPLQLWWSPGRADNFTTTHPEWTVATTTTRAPDYGFARTEGYALPHGGDPLPYSKEAFHYGTMGGGPTGARDLLVLMSNYVDAPFRHTQTQVDQLMFGPGAPNVVDYVSEMSQGRFTWRRGAVLGPFTFPDDPQTAGSESRWDLSWDAANPNVIYVGLQANTGKWLMAMNGGGSTTAAVAERLDAWETYNLADLNGGTLNSGDPVAFKSQKGPFLNESSGALRANGLTPTGTARFTIEKAGGGAIVPGDAVALRAWNGRYISALTGGALSVTAVVRGSATWFTLAKSSPDLERQLRGMVQAAAASGYNFAVHDKNGDGRITDTELSVIVYGSGPAVANGAATRGVGSILIPGTSLRLEVGRACGMGEDVSLSTITHELTHLLGTVDLYGASGLNQNLTLMGATIFWGADDRQVFHLDPWHKMRLGWVEPRIHTLNEAGASAFLAAVNGSASSNDRRPWLLVDPRRYDIFSRSGEYFMVEFRNPALGRYDASAPASGVVVWQIKTDSQGNILIIDRAPTSTGTIPPGIDASVNTFGASTGTRGGNTPWTASNGTFALRYIDNTDAQFRLRVGPFSSSTAQGTYVEWTRDGVLRPRLVQGSVAGRAGGLMSMDGMFPVSSTSTQVTLRSTSTLASYPLSINSWSGTRFLATLPASIPPGSYDLLVREGWKVGNVRSFTVNP